MPYVFFCLFLVVLFFLGNGNIAKCPPLPVGGVEGIYFQLHKADESELSLLIN